MTAPGAGHPPSRIPDRPRRSLGSRRRRRNHRRAGRHPHCHRRCTEACWRRANRSHSVDRLGIRIDQQLGRVEPQAPLRRVRSVDPVTVSLTGADLGHIDMPLQRGAVPDVNAPLVAVVINRHSSTRSAFSENREKLTPFPSQVAPCGNGRPGRSPLTAAPSACADSTAVADISRPSAASSRDRRRRAGDEPRRGRQAPSPCRGVRRPWRPPSSGAPWTLVR